MTASTATKVSPLLEIHRAYGAKMTEFAGYDLPLYFQGFKHEHMHTRSKVSLFDISHMGQIELSGENLLKSLEKLVPADLQKLKVKHSVISVLLNERGGVIDDLMITRLEGSFKVVANGAQKQEVIEFLQDKLNDAIELIHLDEYAFIALQGPEAITVLNGFNEDIQHLKFLMADYFELDGITCFISRSGYTGEDGFEISVNPVLAEQLVKLLLQQDNVKPAGLGSRDSLRLEAGLCLYGHELNQTITPVEAGLSWMIAKSRRGNDRDFNGKEQLLSQLKEGVEKTRTGLIVEGKVPVREGEAIFDENENEVGFVTSGVFSPSLNCPIAQAYIDVTHATAGNELYAKVRKKTLTLKVTELPFIERNYKK